MGHSGARQSAAAIAERLSKELAAVLATEDVAQRFAPLGVVPSRKAPADFRALIESETARWAEIVKSAGIVRRR